MNGFLAAIGAPFGALGGLVAVRLEINRRSALWLAGPEVLTLRERAKLYWLAGVRGAVVGGGCATLVAAPTPQPGHAEAEMDVVRGLCGLAISAAVVAGMAPALELSRRFELVKSVDLVLAFMLGNDRAIARASEVIQARGIAILENWARQNSPVVCEFARACNCDDVVVKAEIKMLVAQIMTWTSASLSFDNSDMDTFAVRLCAALRAQQEDAASSEAHRVLRAIGNGIRTRDAREYLVECLEQRASAQRTLAPAEQKAIAVGRGVVVVAFGLTAAAERDIVNLGCHVVDSEHTVQVVRRLGLAHDILLAIMVGAEAHRDGLPPSSRGHAIAYLSALDCKEWRGRMRLVAFGSGLSVDGWQSVSPSLVASLPERPAEWAALIAACAK